MYIKKICMHFIFIFFEHYLLKLYCVLFRIHNLKKNHDTDVKKFILQNAGIAVRHN